MATGIGLAIVVMITGCTHTFRFRVVDANTGAPIRDASATRESKSDDLILGSKRSSGQLPPSNADGLIEESGLPANMVHTFIFHKPGYFDAQAVWEGPQGGLVLLESPSPGKSQAFTSVKDVGVVPIPMYPTTQPTER